MKIFVTGTRGIPDIPGGIEKHCQMLYPRIAAKGHEVLLATRQRYVTSKLDSWQGVKLVHCFSPKSKYLEAFVHTFIALLNACWHGADIVHIHAVGPSLFVPLARLLGLKVVVTHHGPDYHRQKWGKSAKPILRLGEKMAGVYAHEIISISSLISEIIRKKHQRESHLIYNGITFSEPSESTEFLGRIGIEPQKYILAVARFVPEKGLHDLIDAFRTLPGDYKLVIAGEADHETLYSKHLRQKACEDERIILPGYLTGEPLHQLYTHSRLFVLPSYHEGLPISLLEAISYGVPVLVSDIPANKEVGLEQELYFHCGNVQDLGEKIALALKNPQSEENRRKSQQLQHDILRTYNWDDIAEKTSRVYEKAFYNSQRSSLDLCRHPEPSKQTSHSLS